MAIDEAALKICQQRGHEAGLLGNTWSQCRWCGMWIREIKTIEERRDEPPLADQNPLIRARG